MKKLICILVIIILAACSSPEIAPVPIPTSTGAVESPEVTPTLVPTGSEEPVPTPSPEPTQGMAESTVPFDQFVDESFARYFTRDPEWVITEGLADQFPVPVALTDISSEYQEETYTLVGEILDELVLYDRAALSPEQQTTYDVLAFYLEDILARYPYRYHAYPVTFMLDGVHNQTEYFFADYLPVRTRDEAEGYIARLWLVQEKFDRAIADLALRQENGITLPQFALWWTMGGVQAVAESQPEDTPYYTAFAEKLQGVAELTAQEKEETLAAAREAIAGAVIPAYQSLLGSLNRQLQAPGPLGVGNLPNGEAYYAFLLQHYTNTTLTAEEIHALGLTELERIHGEMRAAFRELGYPDDLTIPEAYQRLGQEGETLYGQEILEGYEGLISTANEQAAQVFDLTPKANVVVLPDPYGGFYVSPALDGSRPGAFYAQVEGELSWYTMPTLAYHEAVPGHHFQIALAGELDLPLFRRLTTFTSFAEGWALYAERLAYELGWYADDPAGNLGRLQAEAFRAVRLVVDTGIHAKGWTFDEAVDFFVENTGFSEGYATNQIGRYAVWPGQACAYAVGMLKILELRSQAQEQLGDQFSLREFHNVVLGNGSVPLPVLERLVEEWTQRK